MLDLLFRHHLVTLFMILLFSIKLWTRRSFKDTETKYFWMTLISCLLLVLEDTLETMAALDPSLRFFRTLLSVIGFTFRSVAALGLLLVVIPKKQRSFALWIPCLITFVVCCTAFFTDIAFGFDEEYGFHRGPLGYVAFVVPIFYLIYILWIIFKHFSERKSREKLIMPVCAVFCLATTAVDVLVGGTRLNEAIMISSIFFYLVLYSRDNRRDPLTGLLNRQAFYDDCGLYDKTIGAVASLDMNGLKDLNDSCGHHAGDTALVTIAECMRSAIDRNALAYRVGGDEFIILFLHRDEDKVRQEKDKIVQRIEKSGYSVSAGYAMRQGGRVLDDTIRDSDARMYEDKANHYRESEFDRRRR